MMGAEADRLAQLGQGGGRAGRVQQASRVGDGFLQGGPRAVVARPAAKTGPETRPLGLLGGVEECYPVPLRPARGARGATVDSGGAHAVEEGTIGGGVPGQDSRPAGRVVAEFIRHGHSIQPPTVSPLSDSCAQSAGAMTVGGHAARTRKTPQTQAGIGHHRGGPHPDRRHT